MERRSNQMWPREVRASITANSPIIPCCTKAAGVCWNLFHLQRKTGSARQRGADGAAKQFKVEFIKTKTGFNRLKRGWGCSWTNLTKSCAGKVSSWRFWRRRSETSHWSAGGGSGSSITAAAASDDPWRHNIGSNQITIKGRRFSWNRNQTLTFYFTAEMLSLSSRHLFWAGLNLPVCEKELVVNTRVSDVARVMSRMLQEVSILARQEVLLLLAALFTNCVLKPKVWCHKGPQWCVGSALWDLLAFETILPLHNHTDPWRFS